MAQCAISLQCIHSLFYSTYIFILYALRTFIHTYCMPLYRVATLEDLDEDKVAWIPSKVLQGQLGRQVSVVSCASCSGMCYIECVCVPLCLGHVQQ